MQAIHETVRLAQERNDEECLAFALLWLCRISESQTTTTPLGSTQAFRHPCTASSHTSRVEHQHSYAIMHTLNKLRHLLERCAYRAKELHNHYLYSLSSLALAKFHLNHATTRALLPGVPSSTANTVLTITTLSWQFDLTFLLIYLRRLSH